MSPQINAAITQQGSEDASLSSERGIDPYDSPDPVMFDRPGFAKFDPHGMPAPAAALILGLLAAPVAVEVAGYVFGTEAGLGALFAF